MKSLIEGNIMRFKFLLSSIGKKSIMGITGLGLCLFVFSHLMGNFLLFVSEESYNKYGHNLVTMPFFNVIEIILLIICLMHVFLGVLLTKENRKANPKKYFINPNKDKSSSLASRTMIYHGVVILLFVIYHLVTFKYGPIYLISYNGVEMRDLARLVVEVFQDPFYVFFYVVCMLILGWHLTHGFASSLQSLGFNHPKYTPLIQSLSWVFAIFIGGGFLSQPLYFFLKG